MRLTVLEHRGLTVDPPISITVHPPGITIGRGNDNHLVLADETRQISRLQAALQCGSDGIQLRNMSTVCPIVINDVGLEQQAQQRLAPGDTIRIGSYLILAESPEGAVPSPPEAASERPQGRPDIASIPSPVSPDLPAIVALPHPVAPVVIDPISPAHADGFMDLFAQAAPLSSAPPADVAQDAEPASALPEMAAPEALEPAASTAPAALPPAHFWDDLVAEFTPPPAPATFASRSLESPLAPEPVPAAKSAEQHVALDALAALSVQSVDPLALFGEAEGGGNVLFETTSHAPDGLGLSPTARTAKPAPNHAPELRTHFAVPLVEQVIAPPVQPATVAPATDHAKGAPKHQEAAAPVAPPSVQASVPAAQPSADMDAEQLQRVQALLDRTLGGTMNLLSSRTIIKREVKADLTMILDKENNPLKLLPDSATVLKQMFGPPFPGFMSPEQAIDDAFDDLQAHQIGMLAGMRAALSQLLDQLDPAGVERHMAPASGMAQLFKGGRDGQAWREYRQLHRTMVAAVEDDFHRVFGAAFLAAYEAEVQLYKLQRKGAGPC
ncbi:type VI secretion system-associated FHA domain protein TagH [Chitinolyticbacter meiyuanensis]|uniref:type VI secretion system-associated FHA domain protein TagH n=1 Tax=Chitinolyticbacter meiyuanensis TaxID=682798 RepID=UPI0011E5951A|nr:type VI secretion system-associated FHA domain protein TagH [Chitinolyticbacter meiyuanensis]